MEVWLIAAGVAALLPLLAFLWRRRGRRERDEDRERTRRRLDDLR